MNTFQTVAPEAEEQSKGQVDWAREKANKFSPDGFPMIGDIPVVAVDLDNTLAIYNGWEGKNHIGPPMPYSIWALETFKNNGWEIEIHTCRGENDLIKQWAERWFPGCISRVNETRKIEDGRDDPSTWSPKPKADIFIDDRNWFQFGKPLDWVEIILGMEKMGLFPRGVIPPKENEEYIEDG